MPTNNDTAKIATPIEYKHRRDWLESLCDSADAMDRLYTLLTQDEIENNEFWGNYTHEELPEIIITQLRKHADLEREIERVTAAVRYSLATFRALEQYTFEDSDHGLLIAEAVKKLEDPALTASEPTADGEESE